MTSKETGTRGRTGTTHLSRVRSSTPSASDVANTYGLGVSLVHRPSGYSKWGHGGIYNGHQAGLHRLRPCGYLITLSVDRGFVDDRRMLDLIAE